MGGAVGLGNALNLTGGRTEWASMAAPVQTVTESVDEGRTEIGFGPPAHLSPQDLVELLRGTRRRRASRRGNGGERTTGTPGKSANVMGPTAHPSGKTTVTPPAPAPPVDFTLYDAGPTMSGGSPTAANLGIRNGQVNPGQNVTLQSGVSGLPTGMTAGGSPAYKSSPGSRDTFAWVEVTLDVSGTAPVITALALATGSAVPVPTDDTTYYVVLGDFAVDPNEVHDLGGQRGDGNRLAGAPGVPESTRRIKRPCRMGLHRRPRVKWQYCPHAEAARHRSATRR